MPVRLKAQYLTRMEKWCIGCSGNGTKASTAGAPPRPRVSGERVSTPVNQSWARGGRHGQRNCRWAGLRVHCPGSPASTCFELCSVVQPFIHSPVLSQTHPHAYQQHLSCSARSWVLSPRTKPLLIHGHSLRGNLPGYAHQSHACPVH